MSRPAQHIRAALAGSSQYAMTARSASCQYFTAVPHSTRLSAAPLES